MSLNAQVQTRLQEMEMPNRARVWGERLPGEYRGRRCRADRLQKRPIWRCRAARCVRCTRCGLRSQRELTGAEPTRGWGSLPSENAERWGRAADRAAAEASRAVRRSCAGVW